MSVKQENGSTNQQESITNGANQEQSGQLDKAAKLLDRAFDLTQHIESDFTKADIFAQVGISQINLGLDSSQIILSLETLLAKEGQIYDQRIQKKIEEVQQSQGIFPTVEQPYNENWHVAVDQTRMYERATAKVKHGLSPQEELDTVLHDIHETYDRSEYPLQSIEEYLQFISKAFVLTGKRHQDILDKVIDFIETNSAGRESEMNVGFWFEKLAITHATLGDFDQAIQASDRISGYNPIVETQTKGRAYMHIAQKQIEAGNFQDAINTAQTGVDTIFNSEVSPEHLHVYPEHEETYSVALFLSMIAEAKASLGDDATADFTQATEYALTTVSSGQWMNRVLMDIAQRQANVGLDPRPILETALLKLDGIPFEEDYDGMLDFVYKIGGYEDLVSLQAKMGHISDAYTTLERIETIHQNNSDFPLDAEIAVSLCHIAIAEAQKAA